MGRRGIPGDRRRRSGATATAIRRRARQAAEARPSSARLPRLPCPACIRAAWGDPGTGAAACAPHHGPGCRPRLSRPRLKGRGRGSIGSRTWETGRPLPGPLLPAGEEREKKAVPPAGTDRPAACRTLQAGKHRADDDPVENSGLDLSVPTVPLQSKAGSEIPNYRALRQTSSIGTVRRSLSARPVFAVASSASAPWINETARCSGFPPASTAARERAA